jgi:hypothetical protein
MNGSLPASERNQRSENPAGTHRRHSPASSAATTTTMIGASESAPSHLAFHHSSGTGGRRTLLAPPARGGQQVALRPEARGGVSALRVVSHYAGHFARQGGPADRDDDPCRVRSGAQRSIASVRARPRSRCRTGDHPDRRGRSLTPPWTDRVGVGATTRALSARHRNRRVAGAGRSNREWTQAWRAREEAGPLAFRWRGASRTATRRAR